MVEHRYNASIGGRQSGGSLPVMRLLKSVRVSVLESQVPTLLFARSLLLEIFLSQHVQVSVRRQLCPRWRFLSRLFPDCISGPLLRRSPLRRAMSVERRHAAHHQRRRCHHCKKSHRFEFSGHALGRQPCAILRGNRNLADLRPLLYCKRCNDLHVAPPAREDFRSVLT
jgi:hypothetical protein